MDPVPWVAALTESLAREYPGAERPRLAVLATVDGRGRPRARSVVLRRVTGWGELVFVSDARSDKNAHARVTPAGEVVLWLVGCREQFRVLGALRVIGHAQGGPEREALWRALPDATRAMFHWPDPGGPREADPAAFRAGVAADAPVPGTFEVLVLEPEQAERLCVGQAPHRRTRWRAAAGWREEEINP